MKIVVQRVTEASVDVAGETVGAITGGLVVLVGIEARDTIEDVKYLGTKIWNMRLWPDQDGKPWMESASARNYGLLVISQFTLHGRLKGNKPDFHLAQKPAKAKVLYDLLVKELSNKAPKASQDGVQTGQFGAKMAVKIVNDGPVTLELDTQTVKFPRKIPIPAPEGGGGTAATTASQEVDVPWVAPTGEPLADSVAPLEVDADGMIGPPEGALPPGTPMTTMMFTVPDGVNAGDPASVPLPSGMSVKVRVPAEKGPGDFLQIQVPTALMDPQFRQKQEQARQMAQQGIAIIDFKVPEDKKAGDECGIRLPSGMTIRVTVPEGKVAGDILKVRVPRSALDRTKQVVSFQIPEGKGPGDTCDVRLNSGQILQVKIPEGKKAGDVLQLAVPAPMNQMQVPPGTPMEKIKWTIPEGKGPGDQVKIELPSGMGVTVTIKEGQKAGDVIELNVPRPFLDPKFKEKRAAYQEQQRKLIAEQQAKAAAGAGGLDAIKEEGSGNNNNNNGEGQKKKKNKKKKKKK